MGHPQDTQGLGPQCGAAQEIRVRRALGPLPAVPLQEGCLASPVSLPNGFTWDGRSLAHTSPWAGEGASGDGGGLIQLCASMWSQAGWQGWVRVSLHMPGVKK